MNTVRIDNTDGFTQEQLGNFNAIFPDWANEHGFDLDDEQQLKSAMDTFHNDVMIYG